MNKNRYLIKLLISLSIIENNSLVLKTLWQNEIDKNDGFLKNDIKESLDKMYQISKEIQDKYNILYSKSEIDSTIKSIYGNMNTNKARKEKQEGLVYGYSFKRERDLLPHGMLDSTITISSTINFIVDKLELTVKRYELSDRIQELFNNVKLYVNFTEEELILNKYVIKE